MNRSSVGDFEHAPGGLRRRDERELAAGLAHGRCARTSDCSADESMNVHVGELDTTSARRRATARARRRRRRRSTGRVARDVDDGDDLPTSRSTAQLGVRHGRESSQKPRIASLGRVGRRSGARPVATLRSHDGHDPPHRPCRPPRSGSHRARPRRPRLAARPARRPDRRARARGGDAWRRPWTATASSSRRTFSTTGSSSGSARSRTAPRPTRAAPRGRRRSSTGSPALRTGRPRVARAGARPQ